MTPRFQRPLILVVAIWTALAVALIFALFESRWSLAFVALATFGASLVPLYFARKLGVRLPASFVAVIVLFIFSTLFLGEAFDFYNRFWWWDIALHSGAAMSFGIVGVLFMLMLFKGDRYAAPPWAISFFAFCFAMTIGAVWEIFEYGMDVNFGLNMQKTGLDDTMKDLIVNAIGAIIGAGAGFFYLKGRELGLITQPLKDFVRENRDFFRKHRK